MHNPRALLVAHLIPGNDRMLKVGCLVDRQFVKWPIVGPAKKISTLKPVQYLIRALLAEDFTCQGSCEIVYPFSLSGFHVIEFRVDGGSHIG